MALNHVGLCTEQGNGLFMDHVTVKWGARNECHLFLLAANAAVLVMMPSSWPWRSCSIVSSLSHAGTRRRAHL